MLETKLDKGDVNVWLVNTGWIGGAYGTGERIKLKYTRSLINSALNGELLKESFELDTVFKLQIPENCTNVPSDILNPLNNWENKEAYQLKAKALLSSLETNYSQFQQLTTKEIKVEFV
jgi:phosphoenolpyruvate carboxykinase (ATP)